MEIYARGPRPLFLSQRPRELDRRVRAPASQVLSEPFTIIQLPPFRPCRHITIYKNRRLLGAQEPPTPERVILANFKAEPKLIEIFYAGNGAPIRLVQNSRGNRSILFTKDLLKDKNAKS